MRTKPALTADDTARILAAADAEAVKNGWKVSVAVVDDGGYLLGARRADGAPVGSGIVAIGKARASALMKRPSGGVEELVKARPGFAGIPAVLDFIPVQGGVPILVNGECVGGVGVSGVASHEDEQIGAAGVAALGLG